MKKIAIIGAGWTGCHLAKSLKDNHKVKLIDKSGIFAETSFRNQNRLHMGFHYPRNFNTRKLCYETFDKFCNEYKDIISDVDNNIYAIPKNKSIIDFTTYKNILSYNNLNFDNIEIKNINNIEGAIRCSEKHINHRLAKNYFQSELNDIFEKSKISLENINEMSKKFDLVINCTNNALRGITDQSYYELCLVLLYRKKRHTEFEALTLMDGPFFSIYPYENDIYSVTDVEYTPVHRSENYHFNKKLKINDIIEKIEKKIKYYYNSFNIDFEYINYFTSIKSKKYNESADRYPMINKENNIISCYTGKIQGIYSIEEFVNESINR